MEQDMTTRLDTRRNFLRASAALSLAAAGLESRAQTLPATIRILVGFAAGGATDNVIRTLAGEMSAALDGRPVIVDNKPGANQIPAIQALRAAPPDGGTLFLGTGSSLAQNPGVQKGLPYSPEADFTPIAIIGTSPGAFMVRTSLPVKSLRELIDYARKNPGKLNYGSAGVGSANQLSMEAFLLATDTKMVHVPLKADSAVMLEMQAERIDVSISTMQVVQAALPTGKVRMLALTSVEPLPFAPGVPTLKEANVPGLEGLDPFTFYGLVGPKGMPPEIVRTLNRAVNQALAKQENRQRLQDQLRVDPVSGTTEQFQVYLKKELHKWSELGKRIKLDN